MRLRNAILLSAAEHLPAVRPQYALQNAPQRRCRFPPEHPAGTRAPRRRSTPPMSTEAVWSYRRPERELWLRPSSPASAAEVSKSPIVANGVMYMPSGIVSSHLSWKQGNLATLKARDCAFSQVVLAGR
jgi:hypothetical protein